jgi:hypothetical protein
MRSKRRQNKQKHDRRKYKDDQIDGEDTPEEPRFLPIDAGGKSAPHAGRAPCEGGENLDATRHRKAAEENQEKSLFGHPALRPAERFETSHQNIKSALRRPTTTMLPIGAGRPHGLARSASG